MHCFSCQVSFCSSLSISPLQALGLFCCIGSGIDFHRLEVIAQDVLIARDVPILIVPQPSSGLVVVGRLGRGIVPVDVFHHISLLHMKRLVGDGVHGLLGSPAFQHRPGEHDLPGSSAVVAQPVLVERLDRDLCPVRHPQHGKLIGGQLLCQFGLAVQRRRFPGILRKAGQEFLFVKLCRRFCLRLQGCRCGQVHPAAPHAPARRHCRKLSRRNQNAPANQRTASSTPQRPDPPEQPQLEFSVQNLKISCFLRAPPARFAPQKSGILFEMNPKS